ncbi:MAG TPA: hypothetical protein VGJ20_09055 [Xanthobacteraceae bacterium]
MAEPSAFFRQHHAVEPPAIDALAFRPFWRVRTRLDQLLIDGAISFPEWRAGQIFRTLAERVLAATWRSQWVDRVQVPATSFDRGLAARADALKQLAAIHAALGGFAVNLLEAHIVNDERWKELGPRLGVHPRTARQYTIAAVKALAMVIWN